MIRELQGMDGLFIYYVLRPDWPVPTGTTVAPLASSAMWSAMPPA